VPAPRKYPDELRERSIRFACDLVDGPEKLSVNAACIRVGEQLGINSDTLRNWVKQARVDAGAEPGLTTDERTRLRELEWEVRELRRANAILKTASAFFAAELDRPQRSSGSSRSAGCCASTVCRSPRAPTGRPRPVHCRRAQRDAVVLARIRAVHGDRKIGRGLYGVRKVHAQLRRAGGVAGRPVSRRRVERLRRADGLPGARRGRIFRTTRPAASAPAWPGRRSWCSATSPR
jgi:transposase